MKNLSTCVYRTDDLARVSESSRLWPSLILLCICLLLLGRSWLVPVPERFIVQGTDVATLSELVHQVGGRVTHEIGLINAVGAELDDHQRAQLQEHPMVRAVFQERTITTDHKKSKGEGHKHPDTRYTERVSAQLLHDLNLDGDGVTVAFIDTGVHRYFKGIKRDGDNHKRSVVQYNAIAGWGYEGPDDDSGHGTHVISLAVGSGRDNKKHGVVGVAPKASVVSVKAFDEDGKGRYLDVIRGVDWVVKNRDRLGIRVLNLSFSATPQSYYWDDPLNQAVMAAWQAGIVVVASAGNTGPDEMTIGVPGNVPYVITVGASSDNYTPNEPFDDTVAGFSSAGPTVEGFVKPDVLAPGGRLLGLMKDKAVIGKSHKKYFYQKDHFVMSGTSQSTAIVSGVVALMLQAEPTLTPDDVKCRLMVTAEPLVGSEGAVFHHGSGSVNAYAAAYSSASDCANRNLDIALDLAGIQHYAGPVRRDDSGDFYQLGNDGYMWKDGYIWKDGELFKDGYMWKDVKRASVDVNHWVED